MVKLEYKNFDEINADPARLLDFAIRVTQLYEQHEPSNLSFASFLSTNKEVFVGGKPLSVAAHLRHLSNQSLTLDDLCSNQLRQLHAAGSMLRSLEPTWEIADHLENPGLCDRLSEMKRIQNSEGLASRVTGMLTKAEHSVRHVLRM